MVYIPISIVDAAKIGLDDFFIVLDFRRRALGDFFAEVEHHDPVRDIHDCWHIVLHQHDRNTAFVAHRTHEIDHVHCLIVVHACEWFIEQQHLWDPWQDQ